MNEVAQPQDEVFAFLADPGTHGGEHVKRVDTHAAVLFLGRDRVLKVKRAVRFPFLDYSTLAKRKAACEAEIEVNRPFAPQIYRRVVPITRVADGKLVLDGTGPAIEWALEMNRFDESKTLDRLADAGCIDTDLADALGRAVAAAHARAQPVEGAPWIAAIGSYIDEHVAAFSEIPDLFPAAEVDALARASRAAYERIRPLLAERGRRGLIRRIHGDLHLGNIVLIDRAPVLFDAIEFSPLIGSGDVLYDLAFLLMDLVERDLEAAANVAFNRYLTETRRNEDLDALAALPFYLSMRAAIRAKVTAARLAQCDATARPSIAAQARRHFDWACRFMAPAAPRMVAVGGLSGTGKSLLARALAPSCAPPPGAVVLRSDIERKHLFDRAEDEPLPPDAYRAEVTARVYCTILDKARRATAAGQSAVVDAVFAEATERSVAERSAELTGVGFHGVFLDADLKTRLSRVGARRNDASDANAAVVRAQEDYRLGEIGWPRIDASGTPQDTLARVRDCVQG